MPERERITKDNYAPTLASLWAHAHLLAEQPLAEMIAAAERADAIGPLLEPTLYREKSRVLHEDLEMLRALRHVQTTMADIRQRRAGRA